MPKAPKNAPPDQHASEAGLAVTPDDVRAAAAAISSSVIVTECDQSRTLSEICGCNLWLKFENLQFTSTFKERGALNRLLALSPDERLRGVIAMSAGNHAQGVAYHAHRLGIPATIVMPVGTPMICNSGFSDLAATAIPEISPPPPIGTTSVSSCGTEASISSAMVPCPAMTCGSS